MRRRLQACAMLGALAMALPGWATEPVVYPNKGQSESQQEKDQYACHEWATKDTGIDPVTLAEQHLTTTPKAESHRGELGAAGVGAARGAVDGDAAAGAARGFGIGRMVSVVRAKRQLREQQSNANATLQSQLDQYDRAYAACLTGRGYTVK